MTVPSHDTAAKGGRSEAAPRPPSMLYFVGGGSSSPWRVDVCDLFGRRLAAAGLRVSWYLPSDRPGPPAAVGEYFGQPARICGVSRWPGPLGKLGTKVHAALARLHFFGAALRGRHEIVQVRDDFIAGLLGLLAARLRRTRFVFWLSYPFPEARMADAREGRSRWAAYSWLAGWLDAQALYKVILPACDHAMVQSIQMRDDLVACRADARRLTVVPMGIPDEDVPALQVAADGRPGDERIVLYLGTLARVRKLDMIVRAFALVAATRPDSRLVIVGEGDVPADRAALEAEIDRLQLAQRVTLTGAVPRADALAWVQRATVCLSPYYPTFVLRSTSPTKLVEYMALGKAVVANDHPEQAQILADSGAGACAPWDEAAFAEAIGRLLDDPAERRRAGERGHHWVVAHRRYSVIAAALHARYAALVGRSAGPVEG